MLPSSLSSEISDQAITAGRGDVGEERARLDAAGRRCGRPRRTPLAGDAAGQGRSAQARVHVLSRCGRHESDSGKVADFGKGAPLLRRRCSDVLDSDKQPVFLSGRPRRTTLGRAGRGRGGRERERRRQERRRRQEIQISGLS
jgi:hypothetical protein